MLKALKQCQILSMNLQFHITISFNVNIQQVKCILSKQKADDNLEYNLEYEH